MCLLKCVILENNISNIESVFTWNHKWIWQYESPWGIFEKFKVANEIDDKGIFEFFGSTSVKSKIKKFYSFSDRDLVTLRGFDEKLLNSVFGINLKDVNQKNIKMLIGALPNDSKIEFYINKNLNLCPECIKYGYHSIFHQIKMFDKCPFHNIFLVDHCPNCLKAMPYLLIDKWSKHPYTCSCGHIFYNIDDFHKNILEWSSQKELPIKSPELIRWINLGDEQKKYIKSFALNENVAKFHMHSLIKYLLLAFDEYSEVSETIKHYKITNEKNKYLIRTQKKNDLSAIINSSIDIFNKESYNIIWITFRGVDEYIKRYIHLKQKRCSDDTTEPLIYAYNLWQRYVEGFEYYFNYRNELNSKAWYKNLYFESPEEIQVLEDFYFELKTHFNFLNESNIANYKWLFNRYLCYILISHYLNLVKHCKTHLNKGEEIPYRSLKYENIPFYLIMITGINGFNEYKIEIHWWINKEI